MTKEEMGKIIAVLAAAYPRFEPDELTLNVWFDLLGDLDYVVLQLSVKTCMINNTFPPSIAEVRKAAIRIISPDRKSVAEAWEEVNMALDRFGYYRQVEAIESLSPASARAVRAIGFNNLCLTKNVGVERGQFMKIYEQLGNREQEDILLPDKMRAQIAYVAGRLCLPEKERDDGAEIGNELKL